MVNQRDVDRLARKEQRRNEKLMKHDWRVIEKRRVKDFERSAQDKRIEAMVKKVGKMSSEEVEMELDLEQLGIKAGKASQHGPAARGSSDGGSSRRRIIVLEQEPTGGLDSNGDVRRSIVAIKGLDVEEESHEQGKLFLPSTEGFGTPRSGQHGVRPPSLTGAPRGDGRASAVESVRTEREAAACEPPPISSAEVTLSASKGAAE